jgi:hypothetical protein
MKYSDGNEAMIGDEISIDTKYRGLVVACMDSNTFLSGHESWSYLKHGIMVDTNFGGLVHYSDNASEDIRLVRRGKAQQQQTNRVGPR